jgi:hypothetical protein
MLALISSDIFLRFSSKQEELQQLQQRGGFKPRHPRLALQW